MDDAERAAAPACGPGAELRASDEERERTARLLSEHAATGRLTLAELEERTDRAYRASTRSELETLLADLAGRPDPSSRRRITRWIVALMGGSSHGGRLRLGRSLNVVAIMGGDDIDLRDAELDEDEITIRAFSLMGGSDVYVPDTVDVDLGGFAFMGGNDERGSRRRPRPGAPYIRLRAYSFMGGITVWRLPAETRSLGLKEARRATRTSRELTG